MKKGIRILALLAVLTACCALLCAAVSAQGESGALYVSSSGRDDAPGTREAPLASLAKAVSIAPTHAHTTIYVMSDLKMREPARFWDKHLTITSLGDTIFTVKRVAGIAAVHDPARGEYHAALIEVGATAHENGEIGDSTLRLERIVLDDDGIHEGTIFQYASNNGTGVTGAYQNTQLVQDAIIASYNGAGTITLGNGASLRNYGGMTAVFLTDGSKLVMERGSVIEDTKTVADRQGDAIRTLKAVVEMQEGSCIRNLNSVNGINVICAVEFPRSNITINGEIVNCDCKASHVVQLQHSDLTIGPAAQIHDNTAQYGVIYVQRGAKADVYGKIYDNNVTERGGAISMTNHGDFSTGEEEIVNFYDGAVVRNNKGASTGGGVMVCTGVFTMYGGEISGNTCTEEGGGVYVRQGGQFIMHGGVIRENAATTFGGGIALVLSDGGYGAACVQLHGGEIVNNTHGGASNDLAIAMRSGSEGFGHMGRYQYVSDDVTLGNAAIYFQQDQKTIAPATGSRAVKFGNASAGSVGALTQEARAKNWNAPLATFWVQRGGAAAMTVGGLQLTDGLPVYVLLQATKEDGTPVTGEPVEVYTARRTGTKGEILVTIPVVPANGCAAAIVQPTSDPGSMTITGPESLTEDRNAADYEIDYTATFTMSNNLLNVIKQLAKESAATESAAAGGEIELRIELEPKLNTRIRSAEDYALEFGGAELFEPDEAESAVIAGNTLVVPCKLKADWASKAATLPDDATLTITLRTTGILDAAEFEAGQSLYTTGGAELVLSNSTAYVIPAELCQTRMIGLEMFMLRYESNGGTAYPAEAYAAGTQVALNKTPQRTGFTFTGWYADAALTQRVTHVNMNANKTVYAGWRAEEQAAGGAWLPGILTAQGEHIAYVGGYPDGTVRPNGSVTRAEVAAMLFRLLGESGRPSYAVRGNPFSDVYAGLWYYDAVSVMAGSGCLSGYPDGTFGGGRPITRAELTAVLVRFLGAAGGQGGFADVSASHWAASAIGAAARAGWIDGYPDGTFRPDQPITRAETMAIINRALGRGVGVGSLLGKYREWPDNPRGAWYYYEVIEASNSHFYTGSRPTEDWS